MKLKTLGVGVLALFAGALVPHSSARAQPAPEGCVTDGLAGDAALSLDRAAATIFCSERVECAALSCKEVTAEKLVECLKEADRDTDAIKRCDDSAIADLAACQLAGARGDAACDIDPSGGATLPPPPPQAH